MSTKGVADVVFVIDASNSMSPCIDAVRKHIGSFVEGITSNPQVTWDWRMDFLAHQTGQGDSGSLVFLMQSVFYEDGMSLVTNLYHSSRQGARFFIKSQTEFINALGRIRVKGDETPLIALDTALDYPWRPSQSCHRVVIFLTDEPFETGTGLDWQREQIRARSTENSGSSRDAFHRCSGQPSF